MPTLPSAADYGSSIPNPSRQYVPIQPDKTGSLISAVGNDLNAMVDEETKKLNTLAAQNALNEYETKAMDRAYNPNTGYMNVKGAGVLNPDRPLLKEVPEGLAADASAIAAKLTPQAAEYFNAHVPQVTSTYIARLYGHVSVESERAFAQTDAATLDVAAQKAAHDPTWLDQSLATVDNVVAGAIARQGLSPTRNKDIITVMSQNARAKVLVPVIDGMLSADNPDIPLVDGLLKKYGDSIPKDQLDQLSSRSKEAGVWQVANTVANTALEMRKAGSSPTEVDAYVRDATKDNEHVYQKAGDLLRHAQQAYSEQQDEVLGSLYNRILASPTPAAQKGITDSPEFRQLDPKAQADARKYMTDVLHTQLSWGREDVRWGWAKSDRAQAQADRAAAANNKKYDTLPIWGRYLDLANDPRLATLTTNQISALLPELGPEKVKSLMTVRSQALSNSAKYKIDAPTVMSAVADISDPAQKAAAKGMIEYNLNAWREANPGKIPTMVQEQQIISGALGDFVQKRSWWFDKKTPVYLLDKKTDYTPLMLGGAHPLVVPKDFVEGARAAFPSYTDQQIGQLWGAQLKRNQGNQ